MCFCFRAVLAESIDWLIECVLFQNSKSDKSRSIRAKRSAFSVKIWSAATHLRKSGLATSICAAWHRCYMFSVYHRHHEYSWCLWCLLVKEGVVCSALCADEIPHPLRPERSACSFWLDWIDLVWQIYIDLDLSDFEEKNALINYCV